MLLALLLAASLAGQESSSSPDVLLTVVSEGGTPLALTAVDLAKLPRQSVRASSHWVPSKSWCRVKSTRRAG